MQEISEELYKKIVESSKNKKTSKLFLYISGIPTSHNILSIR